MAESNGTLHSRLASIAEKQILNTTPNVKTLTMEANKRHNYLKFNRHLILSFEIFYFEKHLSEFICSEFTPLKLFYFGNHVSEFICFEFTSEI